MPELVNSTEEPCRRALSLPVPNIEKLSEAGLRKMLRQRDQSITFIYNKFSICGYESLAEVKAILEVENSDLFNEFDKIIESLQSVNAITVVGDRVICSSVDKFVLYDTGPEDLLVYLGGYIKALVDRALKSLISAGESKTFESIHWFTLPGDTKTKQELKEARLEYQKKVQAIAVKANLENRRASEVIVSFFGVSVPKAEDY